MSDIPPYIVLSPVGDHKAPYVNEFISASRALVPPPDKIVLCLDLDTSIKITDSNNVVVRYSPAIDVSRGDLERICMAREILRNYFIYHPQKYEYALWIDTDIMVPPNIMEVLYKVSVDTPALVVVNRYQGRNEGYWSGSGVMLTHRISCEASRFWVGKIYDENGEEKHLSEDLIFFALFDQGNPFIKMWTGRCGRVSDRYVDVDHRLKNH